MGYPPETTRVYRLAPDLPAPYSINDWSLGAQLAITVEYADVGEALVERDKMREQGYPVKLQSRDVTEWTDNSSEVLS